MIDALFIGGPHARQVRPIPPIVNPTWLVAFDHRPDPGSMDYFRNGPGYRLIHEYRARARGCGLEMHYVGIVRR